MTTNAVVHGLEGVIVAETRLSHVDGQTGELIFAGHRVEELAGNVTFEAAAWLLWTSFMPSDVSAVRAALGVARERAYAALNPNDSMLRADLAMDSLRALTARLELRDDESALERATALTAAVGVYVAAWQRAVTGGALVAPDRSLSHAADLWRMAHGEMPHPAMDRALDRYLVTVIDHGMNASTFAARVVASTGSDDVSAIVAAIGALKGPLHGGAPGPVLDMLDAIGESERAHAWLSAELAAGRRIMGMGHRIYRVRDPRAAVLEAGIEELERAGVSKGKLALARAVEREAEVLLAERRKDRPLRANVEFFTAVLLDAMGIDRRAFTSTFAAGRVAGWCAHIDEQRRTGRLIRPASRYVGPWPSIRALHDHV